MTGTQDTRDGLIASGSQTVGPFFHFGLTADRRLGCLAPEGTPGTRVSLNVTVLDGDAAPIPDALIELYQADAQGLYGASPFTGFGRLPTGADGSCRFETIRPGAVPDGHGGLQAPHINVCLFSRGLLRHLYTRIYFAGDPGLDADPLLSAVPEARRGTLLAVPAGDGGTWEYVIRLQGQDETVFFDV